MRSSIMVTHSDEIIIYKHKHFHAAFPSVVKLNSGNLLLSFRRARDYRFLLGMDTDYNPHTIMDHLDPRSHICLMELDSNLNTVNELKILPIDPEAADQDPALLNIGNDNILLTAFSWYPLPTYIRNKLASNSYAGHPDSTGCTYRFWGSHTSFSENAGRNWQWHHKYLKDSSDLAASGAIRGESVKVNGKILLPTYDEGGLSTTLWESSNNGKNWIKKSTIASDMSQQLKFIEPSLCLTPKNKLIAFMRTSGADSRLATATSHNFGKTWDPYILHQTRGEPFHAIKIDQSQMLLAYGYRKKPYGIRYRLVDAECQDIDDSIEIVLRNDAPCIDIGYPWSVRVNSDQVIIFYYMTDNEGYRYIAANRIYLDA